MTDTTYTDLVGPPVNAAWLNDVNNRVYRGVLPAGATDNQYTQGGTGAVSRTVTSKLQESVSVKDFGAVGDGVTDDTAAFNSAWAGSNPKAVLVPAGSTYKITGTVTGKFYSFGVATISGGTVISITNLVP